MAVAHGDQRTRTRRAWLGPGSSVRRGGHDVGDRDRRDRLGTISVLLFLLALRSLLARQSVLVERQTEVVVTMLRRFDDRLGTFAQTLNDTLSATPARDAGSFGASGESEP